MTAYEAVVFDMDGVLVDSEPAFFAAANDVLAAEGQSIDWERYKAFLGTSVEETWRGIRSELGLPGRLREYLPRYGELLKTRLAEPKQALPGVTALLDELERRSVPYALATSSLQPWADIILESCGLRGRFRVMITADDVEREKPAPDVYLSAAAGLRVAAERCIAVEDTVPGIAAAKAAGMFAVQARASSTAPPPIDEADLTLATLEGFPLEMLGA